MSIIIRTRAGLTARALPVALALTVLSPHAATAQVPGTTTVVGIPTTTSNGASPGDLFFGANVDSYSTLNDDAGFGKLPDINDLFGSTRGTLEPGNVIFSDDSPPPSGIESVVFNTAAPVVLSSFTLTLAEGSGDFRATNGFKLYGLSDAAGTTSFLLSSVPISVPYNTTYGSDFISAGTVFTAPVVFQYYRLDTNYFNTGSFSGTRLLELQGFGAPAPEPSQTAALGVGLLGLAGLALKARKRRTA